MELTVSPWGSFPRGESRQGQPAAFYSLTEGFCIGIGFGPLGMSAPKVDGDVG